MKTSANGLNFIKLNEGMSLKVYLDVAGKPTIGVGHLLQPNESYLDGITEAQALDLLASDVLKCEIALNKLIPANCTQNQFDALVDFGFNLGVGALCQMVGHGWRQIPTQIVKWDHAAGRIVTGLSLRRARELALFQTPDA